MKLTTIIRTVLSVFVSIIFLDSLRFKFTDAPETQEIFGRLDAWAGTLGAPGLFGHSGLFSQYMIGGAELVASACVLIGLLPGLRRFQALGALLGISIMSGAISFHLFTPLGIDPNNDGGGLFMAAVGVWFSCLVLVVWNRRELAALLGDFIAALVRDDRYRS
ncbi:hypothetical protein [Maricaulis sp.]|uniref:hypothetical protein n=1 Tax=unclassified Maricaulis TaxID=2632371 RepID=UPI001B2BB536|nr:hypothetical protein [Maricaulis sp.]MBO6797868.1 hypothetical protein [Maricaulis sp.]